MRKRKQCLECERDFKSILGLKKHIGTVHKNIRFECNVCIIEYKTLAGMMNHTRRHHNSIEPSKYACNKCTFNCCSKQTLIKHNCRSRGLKNNKLKELTEKTKKDLQFTGNLDERGTIIISDAKLDSELNQKMGPVDEPKEQDVVKEII